jgi:hypothetical protein
VYVLGPLSSNVCPAGSVRIETEAACRTATAAAGKTAGSPFLETRSSYPRGCYSLFSEAFFNRHTVGAGYLMAQLLCAAVTTGAPPGADALVDVCAPVCAAALGVRSDFACRCLSHCGRMALPNT